MSWSLEDCAAMRYGWNLTEIAAQAWAEVWRFSVMEPRTPRSLTPLHHGTYALGRRPLLPLPREGIGVGDPTPSTLTDSCHSPSPNR